MTITNKANEGFVPVFNQTWQYNSRNSLIVLPFGIFFIFLLSCVFLQHLLKSKLKFVSFFYSSVNSLALRNFRFSIERTWRVNSSRYDCCLLLSFSLAASDWGTPPKTEFDKLLSKSPLLWLSRDVNAGFLSPMLPVSPKLVASPVVRCPRPVLSAAQLGWYPPKGSINNTLLKTRYMAIWKILWRICRAKLRIWKPDEYGEEYGAYAGTMTNVEKIW